MDTSDLAEFVHGVRRTIDWHRRAVAAALAGLAVMAALSALEPRQPPTRAVWTAARDLSGGSPLRAADLALRRIPLPLVPAGALTDGRTVVGRLLAAPVRRGEPLTDVRLLEPSLLAALAQPGQVAVPVRVSDGAAAAALAHPGDVVDILAATPLDDTAASQPRVVAAAVTVLAVPGTDAATGSDAGLVVVAVSPTQASALASAATRSRLSLVLRRP
jgi:pilus assembly protein CpaB